MRKRPRGPVATSALVSNRSSGMAQVLPLLLVLQMLFTMHGPTAVAAEVVGRGAKVNASLGLDHREGEATSVQSVEVAHLRDGGRALEPLVSRRLAHNCDYTAVFNVSFAPSPAPTAQLADAKAATEEALCIWADVIEPSPTFGKISLLINPVATFEAGQEDTIAQSEAEYLQIRRNDSDGNVAYTSYAAAQLRYGIFGQEIARSLPSWGVDYDGEISFNRDFEFSYALDASEIDSSHVDFVSTAAHEIGHALGFTSTLQAFRTGPDSQLAGPFWVQDRDVGLVGSSLMELMTEGLGGLACNPENFPTSRMEPLSSHPIFTSGALCIEDGEGSCTPMHTPDPYEAGSSVSHWSEEYFRPGDIESLLTPLMAKAEVVRCVGPITKRVFRQLGYSISTDCESTCSNLMTGEHSIGEDCADTVANPVRQVDSNGGSKTSRTSSASVTLAATALAVLLSALYTLAA